MNGMDARTIIPNPGERRNMNQMLPTVSMIVRMMPRMKRAMKFWICVMSFVTRVIRAPVV